MRRKDSPLCSPQEGPDGMSLERLPGFSHPEMFWQLTERPMGSLLPQMVASSSLRVSRLILKLCSPSLPATKSLCWGRLKKIFARPRHYPAASPLAAECQRLLRAVPSKYNLDHRSQLLRVAAAILTPE